MPCIPFAGILRKTNGNADNGFSVNGVEYNDLINVPAGQALLWNTGGGLAAPGLGAINTACDKWNAATYRIVSIRHKIMYTGPVTTCAGSVFAYPANLSFTPIGETSTGSDSSGVAPTSGRYLITYNNLGLNTFATRAGTDLINVTGLVTGFTSTPASTQVNLTPPATTQMYRPEQSITLIPKHMTNKYSTIEHRSTLAGLTSDPFTTGDTTQLLSCVARTPNWQCGLLAYDPDWQSMVAQFDNLNSDATFVIETCMCVEIVPRASSNFISLTREVKEDSRVFNTGHKIAADMPGAIPSYSD